MDELVKQNKALIESVTALVDAIQAKMAGDSNELPKEIVDSFDALKGGVEKLKADSTMDEVKKNAHLLKVSDSLKAIVDSIVPKQAEATTEKKDDKPEAGAVQDTVVVEKKDDKPEVDAAAVQAAEQAVTTLTDSAARLTAFVATETKRRADEAHAAEMGKYLLDTVAALDVAEDVKKQVTEALTGKAFEAKENVHTAIADVMKLVNLGVAQERLKNEGIKGKGTAMADVILKSEHLKGVEILTDQILATGMIGSKRESMIDGKDRSHVVRAFLKIFDTIHGANLKAEAEKLASLMDATQTPADFQVPYTISRIVLEEVYSDYMIEKLTDFGPMAAKRDSIPITRYRREGGFATTQFTRKPTNARISELKPGEFGTMAKGKLLTEWFDIDATATKLQAAFSDEFATLSKRTPNITGVSRGIANLIQDLRRSLQQMVFNDMRNSAMAYGSLAFTYNATGDGAHSLYTAVTGASISFGDALTVKVNDVAIKEYEVSATGNLFYVVDAPNGKIQFVDAEGKAANITDTHAIVVTGKKVTNEVRFSLTVDTGYTWERWMNKLLFAVGNQVAAHRQNRGYKPEFLLTSEVTANYMSQAEAYAAQAKRNGFTADSIVGEGDYGRVANLPLFGSDVWDDAYILATQKDATIFRIFEPLILKGPYPTRDTNGGLTGGDEYYVYQEDSLITPLKEKMSLITVIA